MSSRADRGGAMATRGRVAAARVRGGRVLLDLDLISGERVTRVELLQPNGITAVPRIGADVVVMECGGLRGHLVALGGDEASLRVTDAAPGEIGIRDARGQQVVFRGDGIEVTGALQITVVSSGPVVVQAPTIRLGSAGASKRVALHGDPVTGGQVQASATKVFAE